MGQTTRSNKLPMRDMSKELKKEQKLDLAVKNFDDLMKVLHLKVNFNLKGFIV